MWLQVTKTIESDGRLSLLHRYVDHKVCVPEYEEKCTPKLATKCATKNKEECKEVYKDQCKINYKGQLLLLL